MFYGKFEDENKMLQAKSRPYSSQIEELKRLVFFCPFQILQCIFQSKQANKQTQYTQFMTSDEGVKTRNKL